jgi:hypothetical protein
MKLIRSILAALAAFLGLQAGAAHAAGEADFWQWFRRHQALLFDFEKDQERMFNELAAQMHKVHPDLTFEFGPKQQGKREFVISADGLRGAIPAVERLAAAAPALNQWTIVKFRPRRPPFDIGYGDVQVKADTVLAQLAPNGQRIDVTLLIPGHTAATHKTYLGITFLLLDQALGEYDVMTRVGGVDVRARVSTDKAAVTLKRLPAAFDALSKKP